MSKATVWKLKDAKARFSELVRKARTGEPQHVTVRGKEAVIVADAERFEVRPKPNRVCTMAEFIEGSKKYRGILEGINFESPKMDVRPRPVCGDED
jgi:prevent-host-death family protein